MMKGQNDFFQKTDKEYIKESIEEWLKRKEYFSVFLGSTVWVAFKTIFSSLSPNIEDPIDGDIEITFSDSAEIKPSEFLKKRIKLVKKFAMIWTDDVYKFQEDVTTYVFFFVNYLRHISPELIGINKHLVLANCLFFLAGISRKYPVIYNHLKNEKDINTIFYFFTLSTKIEWLILLLYNNIFEDLSKIDYIIQNLIDTEKEYYSLLKKLGIYIKKEAWL